MTKMIQRRTEITIETHNVTVIRGGLCRDCGRSLETPHDFDDARDSRAVDWLRSDAGDQGRANMMRAFDEQPLPELPRPCTDDRETNGQDRLPIVDKSVSKTAGRKTMQKLADRISKDIKHLRGEKP